MSTGFDAITLLKAAPEPDQIGERLDGGPWRGIELCLMPRHVESDELIDAAIAVARDALPQDDFAVPAEAPVAWPSGAHVRVDRLDEEARAGIERSARFAAGVGSPVLTIHLFTPKSPDEFRRDCRPDGAGVDEDEVARFLGFFAESCLSCGVTPLIENVPPILRMRTGGVFLSPIGGHWRDLLCWRERIPELRFTFDVAEIGEPDPLHSPGMKAAYHAIERVIAAPDELPIPPRRRRLRPERFDWQRVLQQPDPVPSVLQLQELVGGRRILITGGGGSIAGSLATLLLGFRPELVTLIDSHEASLTADRAAVDTLVVASTDKAALAASYYGRTKRFMEQLTAYAAGSSGARRIAVRFVNVLGSAGSASELFLRQARAGVPLTITDTGMLRYWITMAHAVTAAAHGALLASHGARLATPAGAPELTVGELATRIWQGAGLDGEPNVDLLGIRRGETMGEVLVGGDERLGEELYPGVMEIESEMSTAAASWVAERISAETSREAAREVWREAMDRPGLIVPV